MRRVGFVLLLLVCSSVWATVVADTVLGPETFNSVPPSGWRSYGCYSGSYYSYVHWYRSSNYYHYPYSAYRYPSYYNYYQHLVTPKVYIPSDADSVRLSFYHRYSGSYTNYWNHIWVSTGDWNACTHSSDFDDLGDVHPTSTSWQRKDVNLDAYIGDSIYVSFVYYCTSYSYRYWYIDWVNLIVYRNVTAPIVRHSSYYHPTIPYDPTVTSVAETVSAIDSSGIDTIYMCYAVDSTGSGLPGGYTCVDMSPISVDSLGNGTYQGTFPAQPEWAIVYYYFVAIDNDSPAPETTFTDTFTTLFQGNYYAYDHTDFIYTEWAPPEWVEISGIGTYRGAGDDNVYSIDLPWSFRYFGQDYNKIYISTNGLIGFSSMSAWTWSPVPTPSTSDPDNVIATVSGDMYVAYTYWSPPGGIYYYDAGDTFYIEVKGLFRCCSSSYPRMDYLVKLVKPSACSEPGGNGEIIIVYHNFANHSSRYNYCSVGMENENGTKGLQYYYTGSYATDSTRFPGGAAPLTSEWTCIKYTTTPPSSVSVGYIAGYVHLSGMTNHEGVVINLFWPSMNMLVNQITTDSTGNFVFAVRAGETYNIYASKGYLWAPDSAIGLTVTAGATTYVYLTLNQIIYAPILSSDFESDDGGLVGTRIAGSWGNWEWGRPRSATSAIYGPGRGHSGQKCWGTVLEHEGGYGSYPSYAPLCQYVLESPTFDLSALSPSTPGFYTALLHFWHWWYVYGYNGYAGGNVQYSTDGGSTWSLLTPLDGYPGTMYSTAPGIGGQPAFTGTYYSGGSYPPRWICDTFNITDLFGHANSKIRFYFSNSRSYTTSYPGWYIDDITAEIGMTQYGVITGTVTKLGDTINYGIRVNAGPFFGYTDSTGHYELVVLPGTWDVIGFYNYLWSADTVTGVSVATGETVVVNLTLNPMFGVIMGHCFFEGEYEHDGITITATNAHTFSVVTNRLGEYSIRVAPDTYDVYAYYNDDWSQDSSLNVAVGLHETVYVDLSLREYLVVPLLSFDFEENNGGFVASGGTPGWQWGVPTSGPGSAHSGSKCWGTNLSGNYSDHCWWELKLSVASISSSINELYFWSWLYTESYFDGGSVFGSTDNGVTWFLLRPDSPTYNYNCWWSGFPLPRPSGNNSYSGSFRSWRQVHIDLLPYRGTLTDIMWVLHSDYIWSWWPGWYIDDVSINTRTLDYGVIRVKVHVGGERNHSGVMVHVGGGIVNYDATTDSIGLIDFKAPFDTYYVWAYKDYHWTADTETNIVISSRSDTEVVELYLDKLPYVTLYKSDFEDNDGNLEAEPPMGCWEWGTPTAGPGGAHSGDRCWATVLDGNYGYDSDCKLITPRLNMAYVDSPAFLSFWHWYHEVGSYRQGYDGGNVKASIDDGDSFYVIYPSNDTYDDTLSFWSKGPAGELCFTGSSDWKFAAFDITDETGYTQVKFMWHFGSDNINNDYGWAVDDIEVSGKLANFGVIKGTVTLVGATNMAGSKVIALGGDVPAVYYTDPDGSYKLFVMPGTYDVAASHGLAWTTDTAFAVSVGAGDTVIRNFTLTGVPVGYVEGYVNLVGISDNSGVTVSLLSTPFTTTTNYFGYYFFGPVLPGIYATMASKRSFVTNASRLFEVVAGETTLVDTINLYPGIQEFDFEDDDGGFVASGGTPGWQWGVPTSGPGSAHSGSKCWGTNLSGNYSNHAWWTLTFHVADIADYIEELYFWSWLYTESYWDGGSIFGSTDNGSTWFLLRPDSPTYNRSCWWSGFPLPNPPGNESYSGSFRSWRQVHIDLMPYRGVLTDIMWVLHTDYSVNWYPGWYIDDVRLVGDFPVPEVIEGCVRGYVYDAETYSVIPNATVFLQNKHTTTNSVGAFIICGLNVGYYRVFASKAGYVTNYEWAIIAKQDTFGPIYIPLSRPQFGPETDTSTSTYDGFTLYGGLEDYTMYGRWDTVYFEICNPYDHPVYAEIWPYASSGPTSGGTFLRSANNSNTVAVSNKVYRFQSISELEQYIKKYETVFKAENLDVADAQPTELPRVAATMAAGDCVDSMYLLVPTVNMPWGFGAVGWFTNYRYWVSSIYHSFVHQNVEFNPATKTPTGVVWQTNWLPSPSGTDFLPYPGDMAYDGRYIWQCKVAGYYTRRNNIYAWNPNTGEIEDSIVDPYGVWNYNIKTGLAYDPAEDVFYMGDWYEHILYKVAGKSWPTPGAIIASWNMASAITAGGSINNGMAGLGFNPTTRTVWIACRNPQNEIIEFYPPFDSVITRFNNTHAPVGNSHDGADVDANGRFWVVCNENQWAYAFDTRHGSIPPGVKFSPDSLTIPGNSCVKVYITSSPVTVPGQYTFYLALYFEHSNIPVLYRIRLNVSPYVEYGWNLISCPVNAVPNNVYMQLSDDIVPFSTDAASSQIYAWDANTGTYYVPTGFERGRGYLLWSYVHDEVPYDITGTPYYSPFTMNLNYSATSTRPGWHLVGNPVNTEVDWDAVVNDPAFTGLDNTYYTWSTTGGFAFYSPGMPGGAPRFIDPYKGFFVRVLPGATGVLPINNKNMTHPKEEEVAETNDLLPSFLLRLSVNSGSVSDYWNYFGVHSGASDGLDATYDAVVPPSFPSIGPSGDKAYFVLGSTNLNRDIKALMTSSTSKTWTFEISGFTVGSSVTISWPAHHTPSSIDASMGINDIYSGYSFTLSDLASGTTINMRTTTSYTFTYTGPRTFTISVGATHLGSGVAKLPKTVSLFQNNPNPFNAATKISFYLPEKSDVKLEVYTIDGKRVRTLASGEFNMGMHTLVWDGTDDSGEEVPSGVYLYKLTAGKVTRTMKMMMVK